MKRLFKTFNEFTTDFLKQVEINYDVLVKDKLPWHEFYYASYVDFECIIDGTIGQEDYTNLIMRYNGDIVHNQRGIIQACIKDAIIYKLHNAIYSGLGNNSFDCMWVDSGLIYTLLSSSGNNAVNIKGMENFRMNNLIIPPESVLVSVKVTLFGDFYKWDM